MIWLLPHPPTPPFPSVSWTGDTQGETEKERQLADGRGWWGGGGGAESNSRKKACSSINHSVLSQNNSTLEFEVRWLL